MQRMYYSQLKTCKKEREVIHEMGRNDTRYIYIVPFKKDKKGLKQPKIPERIGYFALGYFKTKCRIAVSIGGHNYLKKTKYAKYIRKTTLNKVLNSSMKRYSPKLWKKRKGFKK